jgi:hypothetical protein
MSMRSDDVSELQPPTGLLFILQVIYEFGEPRWNDTDRGKTEELGEKPVPVPLRPPQIPHGLTRALTPVSAVNGWRLTTRAMARPTLPDIRPGHGGPGPAPQQMATLLIPRCPVQLSVVTLTKLLHHAVNVVYSYFCIV